MNVCACCGRRRAVAELRRRGYLHFCVNRTRCREISDQRERQRRREADAARQLPLLDEVQR